MGRFPFMNGADKKASPLKLTQEQLGPLMDQMKGKIPVIVMFDPKTNQVAVQATMATEENKRIVLNILAEAIKAVVSHNPIGLIKPTGPLPPAPGNG